MALAGVNKDVMGMGVAVALSAVGMAAHTVREFGTEGLWTLGTGFVPVVGLQLVLLVAWGLAGNGRAGLALALAVTGIVQLAGGAILTVLPLPFLPFEPAQTVEHYLSHFFYGITQIPLIVIPPKWRKNHIG
jgi:hypothetical protein